MSRSRALVAAVWLATGVASAAPPAKAPATTTPAGPRSAPTHDVGPVAKAVLEEDRIVLLEPVRFVPGRDAVAQGSLPILGEVARLLRAHPEIGRLRIDVHAESEGSPAQLAERSVRQAVAVRDQLVRAGVESGRLEARGHGTPRSVPAEERPADAAAPRVELVIVTPGAPSARRVP